MLEILKAILQGIVQGVTEWLPISSTGHMLLFDQFLHMDDPTGQFFDVFKVLIQLGSIIAVVVLYFHRLNPFSPRKSAVEKRQTFGLWGKVLIASVPAGVVGLLLDDLIEGALSTPLVIALALILYGVAFLWMESRHRKLRIPSLSRLGPRTALGIGLFQMLALIPGTSRSGSTILGATLLGTSRTVAAEFSFFMAIPVMVGASGFKLLKVLLKGVSFTALEWVTLLVGMIVAFAVSMVVIRFLMAYIRKHDFKVFGYYRIALGVLVLILLACGVIGK
ncbi:MAG: undecaprenyl-diphosphate phosphatase [Acutalibacteraceae bacterium]|jgi:undecaprenyl-diphosphatase